MALDLALGMQYAVIAVAVSLSAWVVMAKQFPQATRRARIAMALPLLREGRPGWMRAMGRVVAPVPAANGGGDCGGCNGCGPTPTP
jgi:hypothetical protein